MKHIKTNILLILLITGTGIAEEFEFNSDFLNEGFDYDLQKYANAKYVPPGLYTLAININGRTLPKTADIEVSEDSDSNSNLCLQEELIPLLGIKEEFHQQIPMREQSSCIALEKTTVFTADIALNEQLLKIRIGSQFAEPIFNDWDPPQFWNTGIDGLLLDYNANASKSKSGNFDRHSANVYGFTGTNWGQWRARAHYRLNYQNGSDNAVDGSWGDVYAYKPLATQNARITLGETSLGTRILDGFGYTGVKYNTDQSMLPPALQGYAPVVEGIAKTNATVTVTQNDRTIYSGFVVAGPYRINELTGWTTGLLTITLEYDDGTSESYTMTANSLPFLTRSGEVQYTFAVGRPTSNHQPYGDLFGAGELSYGLRNGTSVMGGGLLSRDYLGLAAGLGQDLNAFGMASIDTAQSRATLGDGRNIRGGSYSFSWSKDFNDAGTRLSFAGYRFTERDYMSFSTFSSRQNSEEMRKENAGEDGETAINERFNDPYSNRKNTYNLSISQQVPWLNGVSLSYSNTSYWDSRRPKEERFNLVTGRDFHVAQNRVSVTLNTSMSNVGNSSDRALFLTASMPLGSKPGTYSSSLSARMSTSSSGESQQGVEYSTSDADSSVRLGIDRASSSQILRAGYSDNRSPLVNTSLAASYTNEGDYYLAGSMRGGLTVTEHGPALHASLSATDTPRILFDAGSGNEGIQLNGNNGGKTNSFGLAVASDGQAYRRMNAGVNLSTLPDDMEVQGATIYTPTLTEGAIGYYKLDVLRGAKAFISIDFPDGMDTPIAADIVRTDDEKAVGMVGHEGLSYVSGVKAGMELKVKTSHGICRMNLPMQLETDVVQPLRCVL